MEMHGTLNLVDSEVKSDGFASDKSFNRLIVNNLSEVDQETLDHDVIIFNKEDVSIYTYVKSNDQWKSLEEFRLRDITNEDDLITTIFNPKDQVNRILFYGNSSQLNVDPDLFDFGPIGSPINFVIDFWISNVTVNGTILYNGQKTGQVDLEVNKNLLITTSGAELVKDPNFQANPTTVQHSEYDYKINVIRPNLRANLNLQNKDLVHVALIRSGDTTYLAIDGKIKSSAPSVEYFHYDDVLIGSGYVGDLRGRLTNLRVTKGTDLGWTSDFIPPNHQIIPDANTAFLLDYVSNNFVDVTSNFNSIISSGTITVDQFDFFHQLTIDDLFPIIIDCNNTAGSFKFPFVGINNGDRLVFKNSSKLRLSSTYYPINPEWSQSVEIDICVHSSPNDIHEFVFFNNSWHEITNRSTLNGTIIPVFNTEFRNLAYSYGFIVDSIGDVYKHDKTKLSGFENAIEYDTIFNHNFPYINLDKISANMAITPVTGAGFFTCRMVIRLDVNQNFNIAVGARSILSVNNCHIYCSFSGGSTNANWYTPIQLTLNQWYYVTFSCVYGGYSHGNEITHISSYIYNMETGASNNSGNTYVDYYGYVYGDGFHTLNKCPVSLLHLGWMIGGSINTGSSYLSLFI